MSYETPDDRRYLDTHEWALVEDGTARVGISDFAQDELGDVVHVDLPEVGEEFDAGEAFGVVESIKTISDIYAPVAGAVEAVNEDLLDAPELVNEDPYGDGWMVELAVADESDLEALLSSDEYADQVE